MKKLFKIQENSEMSSRIKLMNKIKYFIKETETIKNTKILELKNSMNEMKNTLESTGNRANKLEERISSLTIGTYKCHTRKKRKSKEKK